MCKVQQVDELVASKFVEKEKRNYLNYLKVVLVTLFIALSLTISYTQITFID